MPVPTDTPPPQLDQSGFKLLSEEELSKLSLEERAEYLKRAIVAKQAAEEKPNSGSEQ